MVQPQGYQWLPEWKSFLCEIETGYSDKAGSRSVVGSLPHKVAKAIMSRKFFLFQTNSLGTHGAHSEKPKQQEMAWDENRAPLAPTLGGEAGMDSRV